MKHMCYATITIQTVMHTMGMISQAKAKVEAIVIMLTCLGIKNKEQ